MKAAAYILMLYLGLAASCDELGTNQPSTPVTSTNRALTQKDVKLTLKTQTPKPAFDIRTFEEWVYQNSGMLDPDETQPLDMGSGSAWAYYRSGLPKGWFVFAHVSGQSNKYSVSVTVPRENKGKWAGDLHIRLDGDDYKVDAGWFDIKTSEGDEICVYDSDKPMPDWLTIPISADMPLKMRVAKDTTTLIRDEQAHAVFSAIKSAIVWGGVQLPKATARADVIAAEKSAKRDQELWGE